MCITGDVHAPGAAFDGAAGALRMAGAALDYLNSGSVADLGEFVHMLEFHAVVQSIPQPSQRHGHEPDEGLRVVRGNLLHPCR